MSAILNEKTLKTLKELGYDNLTEIQKLSIPIILKNKDLLACAQTGTGKTAAFVLPLLEKFIQPSFNKKPKVLIITPTRELAFQIKENTKKYSKYLDVKTGLILGGVHKRSQIKTLKEGTDILIATPGRLLDLIKQKHVKLDSIETLILDEADTMLDMGFIVDIKKIINYIPKEKQTLMFSATMPKEIRELANNLLKNPEIINLNSNLTIDKIEQKLYHVDKSDKLKLLMKLLESEDVVSALIFTRTKSNANKLGNLLKSNSICCDVIHGDKPQRARTSAIKNFKNKKSKFLVATDVASRGIDVKELSHVINFEMPNNPESYVHRIGRTGRAGLSGIAISFCDYSERKDLSHIEKLIKKDINVIDHNYKIDYQKPEHKKRKSNKNKFKSNNKFNNKKTKFNINNKKTRNYKKQKNF